MVPSWQEGIVDGSLPPGPNLGGVPSARVEPLARSDAVIERSERPVLEANRIDSAERSFRGQWLVPRLLALAVSAGGRKGAGDRVSWGGSSRPWAIRTAPPRLSRVSGLEAAHSNQIHRMCEGTTRGQGVLPRNCGPGGRQPSTMPSWQAVALLRVINPRRTIHPDPHCASVLPPTDPKSAIVSHP